MLKSKIHRATVTHADLHYEGSCTIDAGLLEAAGIVPYEEVHVWNVTRGTRLVTYAIQAPPGSRTVCLNGAAAHLGEVGDLVIISSFAEVDEREVRTWRPRVVALGERNTIRSRDHAETPGPSLPEG